MLSILFITAIAYAITVGYLVVKLYSISLREAYEKADLTAKESANLVRNFLNKDMDISRTMVHTFRDFQNMPQERRIPYFIDMIHGIAVENPDILSVWGSWEINMLDSTYKKPYGRHRYTFYRENELLKYKEETLNTEGDDIGGGYHNVKISKKEAMIDPYWFSYTENSPLLLESSTAVPLLDTTGRFAGLFGLDIELSHYQSITNSIEPFENSLSIMLSHNGTIVGHPKDDLLGEKFAEHFESINEQYKITEKVYNGEDFSFVMVDSVDGEEYYSTFASIPIGETDTPWSFGLKVPTSVLTSEAKAVSRNSIILSLVGLGVLAVALWLIAYSITVPLTRARNVLRKLALGKIDSKNKLNVKTGDEVEDISTSINTLIDGLSKTSNFANEIGKGNLKVDFKKLSDSDVLGESLLEMRKSLIHAKEQEELRKLEDDKINWATSGMAKFAEILRQNNDNIEEFSYQLISNIVKYINASIGAFFLYNDDNKEDIHFELIASYAYERRKHIDKRLEVGEGLVGRCAQELETIFLTDIPEDYVQIGSGLGQDNPRSLLLVPLKLNEVVYGVVELASLEVFEPHVIDFVEKIGESIAATISTVKINLKTVKLLEESRIKSEELASQEEEMRQNMEELQATQEEAARKTAEMESLINALNESSYVIEYDEKGKVISVNDAYLKLTNQSADQIIGTHHADNLLLDDQQLEEYNKFWDTLIKGNIKKETSKVKLDGNVYTFIETYSPIFDENYKVVKVLKIAHNITDFINDDESKSKTVRKKKK